MVSCSVHQSANAKPEVNCSTAMSTATGSTCLLDQSLISTPDFDRTRKSFGARSPGITVSVPDQSFLSQCEEYVDNIEEEDEEQSRASICPDSVSLGSLYRELYKELPVQVSPSRRNSTQKIGESAVEDLKTILPDQIGIDNTKDKDNCADGGTSTTSHTNSSSLSDDEPHHDSEEVNLKDSCVSHCRSPSSTPNQTRDTNNSNNNNVIQSVPSEDTQETCTRHSSQDSLVEILSEASHSCGSNRNMSENAHNQVPAQPAVVEQRNQETNSTRWRNLSGQESYRMSSMASMGTSCTVDFEDSVAPSKPPDTDRIDHFKVAIRLRPPPRKHDDISIATSTAENITSPSSRLRKSFSFSRSKKPPVETEHDPVWNVVCSYSDDRDSHPMLVQSDVGRRQVPGRNVFSFDNIFTADQSTSEVYETVAKPIVDSVVSGCHGTVFAYGQTGSGKTHTMQGCTEGYTKDAYGIIQLATVDILEQLEQSGRSFQLSAQFFEIYNEQVRDLLRATPTAASSDDTHSELGSVPRRRSIKKDAAADPLLDDSYLTIHEEKNADGNVNVSLNALSQQIKTVADIEAILQKGDRNRAVACTAMNSRSSRSHAIFRLTLESHATVDEGTVRRSVLNLVDLAGSENCCQAKLISGLHKKEAGKINQSLLALSRVIHALSLPPKRRPKYIGYRDSKLTRIMQPHLSGNACLAVLCCISPLRKHLAATRSTLKFADSAKRIQVRGATVNETTDPTVLLHALQKELEATRETLRQLQEYMKMNSGASRRSSKQSFTASFLNGSFRTDIMEGSSEIALIDGLENTDEIVSEHLRYTQERRDSSCGSNLRSGAPPMREVTVTTTELLTAISTDNDARLRDAEERVLFLSKKLEATDDLVGALFQELREVQAQNVELELLNIELTEKLKQQQGEDALDVPLFMQQCVLLKYSVSIGLTLYLTGQSDFFLASVYFVWLSVVVFTH